MCLMILSPIYAEACPLLLDIPYLSTKDLYMEAHDNGLPAGSAVVGILRKIFIEQHHDIIPLPSSKQILPQPRSTLLVSR